MLEDLRQLLQQVPNPMAMPQEIATAIVDGNCLGKRSKSTRQLTLKHLRVPLRFCVHPKTIRRRLTPSFD